MKDKEFNKLMNMYVESTKGFMENDLNDLKKPEFDNCAKRKSKKKIVWTCATVLITIVVILSIVLPVTLIDTDDDNRPPVIYQIDLNHVTKIAVSDIVDVPNYNSFIWPQIDFIDGMVLTWQLNSNHSNIGFEMQVNIWNEYIESIELIVLKKEYEYNLLNRYYHLSNGISWNGYNVYYEDEAELNGVYLDSYICFERDGYKYFIQSKNYELVPITELLEMIF